MVSGFSAAAGMHPAGFVLSQMASAIQAMYQMGSDLNGFIDDHIAKMKGSDNPTIAKTGNVLESAKYGFGIGYMSSVIIMAVGQLLMGNPMGALGTAATAATMTNPFAMTCAAVGAIYYGWGALSTAEQDAILYKLKNGLEIGIETIKAIVAFVIRITRELLSPENIAEFKAFIKTYAAKFGKSLSDVTGTVVDTLKDAAEKTAKVSVGIYESTAGVIGEVATHTGNAASSAAEATSHAAKSALEAGGQVLESTSSVMKRAISKAGGAAAVAAGAASASAKGLYGKTADAASQLRTSKSKATDSAPAQIATPSDSDSAKDSS